MRGVVVILDALDECRDLHDQLDIFMDTITEWSRLPQSFKLMITSRNQPPTPSVCHITLEIGDFAGPEVHHDIQTFFEQRFAEITSLHPSLPSWPGQSIIKQLTDQAAGLFIWAETVVRFLEEGSPTQRLDLILDGSFDQERVALDNLYLQILHFSFRDTDSLGLDMSQRVVGAIVVAEVPLHPGLLIHLLGEQENEMLIHLTLDKLSNVISLRQPDGQKIKQSDRRKSLHSDSRIYIDHSSFVAFLTNARRCRDARFFIDEQKHHAILAHRCLEIMGCELRFNICGLASSYRPNREIEDLEERKLNISSALRYGCLYWAHHLIRVSRYSPRIGDISTSLIDFFVHRRFLYWLETLSLLEKLQEGVTELVLVANWIKVCL
jgi:hypothetical protein